MKEDKNNDDNNDSNNNKLCTEKPEDRPPIEAEINEENGTDTWTWLIDMEGAQLSDAPSWDTLRKLDDILFAHYPGRLGKAVFVNMSGKFVVVGFLVKGQLHHVRF